MSRGGARRGAGRKPTGKRKVIAVQVRLETEAQKGWLQAKAGVSGVAAYLYELLKREGMPK